MTYNSTLCSETDILPECPSKLQVFEYCKHFIFEGFPNSAG